MWNEIFRPAGIPVALIAGGILTLSCAHGPGGDAPIEPQDEFVGQVVVEWLSTQGADRDMRLVEDFAYIDPAGKRWQIPAAAIVNGASIPRVFWSSVGPPFVGDYRRASVVHDHYCRTRTESWRDVHRMFYDASVTGGVSELRAKLMYAAVFAGGPRWELDPAFAALRPDELRPAMFIDTTPTSVDEAGFSETARWIAENNPTLEEIERRVSVEDPAEGR